MKSAKLVKFNEDISTDPPPKTITPITSAGKQLISNLAALHPDLRDSEPIRRIAEEILQLFINLNSKMQSTKRFDDPTFLPTSCRLKIAIKGTARVSKLQRFKDIQQEAEDELNSFKKKMCGHMKSAALVEIEELNALLLANTTKLADMIVKVRMLQLDGASRGHTKSNELTIKVLDPITLDEDGDADVVVSGDGKKWCD